MKKSSTVIRVIKYISRYTPLMVVSIIMALVSVAGQLYIPILQGDAIDKIIDAGNVDINGILKIIGIILITMAVVAPEHKSSLLNSAFATELGDFIADSRIDAWIFGHSHANIDATIGNTRIVCNQLGYVYYRENLGGFDGGKFIEV